MRILDPVQEAADFVNANGDAFFQGETEEVFFVHHEDLEIGSIYRNEDNSLACKILERVTKEVYLERCCVTRYPHVLRSLDLDRCFFFRVHMD